MTETHQIIERDAAIVEFHLSYNPEKDRLEYDHSTIEEGISSYDSKLSCTCGDTFDTLDEARTHIKPRQ